MKNLNSSEKAFLQASKNLPGMFLTVVFCVSVNILTALISLAKDAQMSADWEAMWLTSMIGAFLGLQMLKWETRKILRESGK